MRIAIAGNPNTGKTTLFNALTGARGKIANFPGVTVESKTAPLKLADGRTAECIDLPGVYSLAARSPEEQAAREILQPSHAGPQAPDLVVCLVDATHLGRSLYLAVQLRELGLPLIVALNMMDLAHRQKIRIDVATLGERLGVPVVALQATRGASIAAVRSAIERVAAGLLPTPPPLTLEAATHAGGAYPAGTTAASAPGSPAAAVPTPPSKIAARYALVDQWLHGVINTEGALEHGLTRRLDQLLLHPVAGSCLFALCMAALFQLLFAWAGPIIDAVEWLMKALAGAADQWLPAGLTQSLLTHGIITGVGNVLTALPQIVLLFVGISLLEESGYMARAAFLADSLMRRVGLQGKAVVPLMSSFACAVPGIMATRTIEAPRDRLITVLVAPFISCSARLPLFVLVVAAIFAATPPVLGFVSVGGLVMAGMYLLGFVAALGTAWLMQRGLRPRPAAPFVLELPLYQVPRPGPVARAVYERSRTFVVQTGVVIVSLSVLLWALLSFPVYRVPAAQLEQRRAEMAALSTPGDPPDAVQRRLAYYEQLDQSQQLKHSLAGRLGRWVEPLLKPLGFDWRISIGLMAAFAARESLVSTLAQVYALDSNLPADSPSLREALLADLNPATGRPRFSPLVGINLMIFFALALQCFATSLAVKRETKSWRWPLYQFLYMNALAYAVCFAVYQGGVWLGLGP